MHAAVEHVFDPFTVFHRGPTRSLLAKDPPWYYAEDAEERRGVREVAESWVAQGAAQLGVTHSRSSTHPLTVRTRWWATRYFDAYIQARYVWEVETCEAAAWAGLAAAAAAGAGSKDAIAAATAALVRVDGNVSTAALRAKVFELKAVLNHTIGEEVVGNQDPAVSA